MNNQARTPHRSTEPVSSGRGFDGCKPRIAPAPDPRRSRSLEYGVAILESFTASRPVLRISELADIVGISRSTTHRYVTTLVELGYLEQDSKRRYRLTRNAARAGMAAISRVRQETPARAILEDLREQTGHTASIGLLDGARVLYVVRLYGHRTGQFEADGDLGVGAHVPAHSTAVGKALLASLLDSELRSLLPSMRLNGAKPNTTSTQASLAEKIETVRKDGIAVSNGEYTKDARSIAAPITRWLDKPILAVEITVPADAYPVKEMLARFGPLVKHAARLLSA
jgi:IclR family pca regulon transcriptional regulator